VDTVTWSILKKDQNGKWSGYIVENTYYYCIISGKELVDQIFEYSRTNLALVNVYIKNPVVSRIRSYCVEVILYILAQFNA
jgi:hypothetical protein